jgi:hypothetical protein
MLLPRPEVILKDEAEESERAFLGEDPLSVLVDPRFL